MKVKTSVTLEREILKDIEKFADGKSRSEFIETAISDQIRKMKKKVRDQRDLEIINKNAKRLNREAVDALRYQIPI